MMRSGSLVQTQPAFASVRSVTPPAADAVSAEGVQKLVAELGLQPDAPVVGFVGRLAAKRKGFADFLAAAQEICVRIPNCQFLVVGERDRRKADAVDASAAGAHGIAEHCVFAGQRENGELPAFYKLMNVLVLPSIFEGLPRAVMEASAMGVPALYLTQVSQRCRYFGSTTDGRISRDSRLYSASLITPRVVV